MDNENTTPKLTLVNGNAKPEEPKQEAEGMTRNPDLMMFSGCMYILIGLNGNSEEVASLASGADDRALMRKYSARARSMQIGFEAIQQAQRMRAFAAFKASMPVGTDASNESEPPKENE